jgi:hypothetical protein
MGLATLVLGESGSGKSTSLRNFERNEILVFNTADKVLPFRKKLNVINLRKASYSERYHLIKKYISKHQDKCKVFVIDDSQYLMAFEMFDRAKETGYNKFTDIALDFKNLLDFIQTSTNEDVTVYLLHHTELNEVGKIKAKTSGKMIDNQLTLEGLFSIVLMTRAYDGNFKFLTQSDGLDPVKTPLEMFTEKEIDNDLKSVDKIIREYYEMPLPYKEESEEAE